MLRPRIVYLAALAVAAIVFVGTNEPPALAFLALLALLPAACKLAGVAAARGMTVEQMCIRDSLYTYVRGIR